MKAIAFNLCIKATKFSKSSKFHVFIFKGWDMTIKNEGIKPHAKACVEIAKELEIEVFDLWTEMEKIAVSIY